MGFQIKSQIFNFCGPDIFLLWSKCTKVVAFDFMRCLEIRPAVRLIKYAHNTYDGRTRKDTVGRYII